MGERSGEDGLFAQAKIAPLTGLAESLGIDRETWIQTATQPLPETLRLTMHHYDVDWTRQQLLAMGATPLSWSVGNEAYQLPFARGQAPRDGTRELLALLHDTGRVDATGSCEHASDSGSRSKAERVAPRSLCCTWFKGDPCC